MTGTQTLIARAALGTLGAVASVVLTSWRHLRELPARNFDRSIVAALALSRLCLFVVLFLALHLAPRGDVPGFYFPQAVEVLEHHAPYRDFPSSYAPLHPYLDALFISVRRTPLAIIFASILAECFLLPLWLRLGRGLFNENTMRTAALLYLASPISLQFVAVDGQDNVLIALMLAGAVLLALRSRAFVSGALLGFSAATIKFLPLLFAPAFFVTLPKRQRWAAGAVFVLAVVYGGASLFHLPVVQPLTAEGAMHSAGNLPYLTESAIGLVIPARLSDSLLLLILGGVILWSAPAVREMLFMDRIRALIFTMAALTLVLLLFSKKSWPAYLMLCLFPLCLLVADSHSRSKLTIVLFALFSVTAVTEHSVWSSLLLEATSAKLHAALLAGDRVALIFFVLHAALLAGYLWLLVLSLRALRTHKIVNAPSNAL